MNIFKLIKDTITQLVQDEDEETLIRIGKGHISLDKDMGYDGYTTILDIPFNDNKNEGKDKSSSDNITEENTNYYCVASSVVNVGNIFGGIYAASFVVAENSDKNNLKFYLDAIKNNSHDDVIHDLMTMMNTGVKRSVMIPDTPMTAIWDISTGDQRAKSAFIVVRYIDANKYNNNRCIGSDFTDFKIKLLDLLLSNKKCFQNMSIPENAINSILNGFSYAINHGYDGTMDDPDDEEKMTQKYQIPTICRFGDRENIEFVEEFCNGFLEIEKLIIGKTIRDVCELSYIPEITDCMWTDVPYFEKIKKKYKKVFDSPRIKEIAKLNILKLLED